MRILSAHLSKFRRFADLRIQNIPDTAKLVILAGPNGSGKSSLFDAFLLRYRMDTGFGWNGDTKYYDRPKDVATELGARVTITSDNGQRFTRGGVYVRSAYRNDHEFAMKSLTRQGAILDTINLNRMIEPDATVSANYGRLAAQAMEDVFVNEDAKTTMGDYREKMIGEVREPLKRLFPDLTFVGVGNPLDQGTFQFDKGTSKGFDYKNLSGGEKASFDLILDFVVKRRNYADAIYCIDEPEAHMNTKLQGALLGELVELLPGNSQLWIASHSIGMMRKARELYNLDPNSVVFLDFGDRDFDQPVVMPPSKPTRAFWESVMHVALDDLASLVAPRQVMICEGNPMGPLPGKNAEHDARIYETIFAEEFPDVTFISAGNAKEVAGDFLGLAAILPKVAAGMKVSRLIDHDDHAQSEVQKFNQDGIKVLSRRHLEAYIYDDETLTELCASVGKPESASDVIAAKTKAIADSVRRGNPSDDIKSAAGRIYTETKRLLALTQVGNDQMAFARSTLAPLIKPGMTVYAELKADIFGG
ncbi:AAA family ATPase [Aminobacter sp. NyZ550]|uniref:AAA family ATPase n=1 Tax=Aminobacter sp. NyZ550 TaxID=2979870 RepID=UPI0021D59E8D|nr:AAA family ATPase [Aminobacter sp. NyZ550]WAX93980.1 AAA family ATPase [Aminobacter sp. NyZ550]